MKWPPDWHVSWDGARYTTLLAIVTAAILLVASVVSAWISEIDFRSQKVQQAEAHARVLAASVSAALAFDEASDADQAIDALRANPDIGAVGIYRLNGAPFVVRGQGWNGPPATLATVVPPRYVDGSAIATVTVRQEGSELGRVYVQLSAGSGPAQSLRYVGIALLLLMAAVLVGVIAVSQRTLAAANDELARRAAILTRANDKLREEMAGRKQAERALAQAQKMEAIGQLTGGLAHDFNNILAAISGGVRLLEKQSAPERRALISAGLADAVERGARLTRQLLTFARGQNLDARVIDPCERIASVLEIVRRTIGEDVAVEADIVSRGWNVVVDPDQLELVILNLAVNARDAMPDGGRLRIRCETVVRSEPPAGEFVRITVADSGTGMTPETVERAFEPFFTTKDVGKGTGLGLAQVYGFARQAGGVTWIESEPERGTSVHIDLPRTMAAASAGRKRDEALANPQEPLTGDGRRILIVEDDETVATMVRDLLASHGYVCDWAMSGKDALGRAADSEFHLVFSDVVMPGGVSGIDLARELRRTKPTLPVLLTTGFIGKAQFEPGEFEILYKPWTPEGLLHAVHRWIADGGTKSDNEQSSGQRAGQ